MLPLALACGLAFLAAQPALDAIPDLRPVMPEVDGVHPVRAAEALRTAWEPGGGFRDKYPPLASALMGLLGAAADPGFAGDAAGVGEADEPERTRRLWSLRERIARLLAVQRLLSRAAMAAAVALLAALGVLLAGRIGLGAGAARTAGVLAAALFGLSYPALYYGGTTNVDALALAASVGALHAGARRRWTWAAAAAALAVACKDPAFVLGPLVIVGAWCDARPGRARRVARAALAGLAVYAAASGALTGPAVWVEHVRYLLGGGVSGVDRIDPTDPAQWPGLLWSCARLLAGATGWPLLATAAGGLVLLWRRARADAGWLLGAVLVTVALFVLPAGFAYVRFLLVPLAVAALAAALALATIASRAAAAGTARGAAVLAVVLAACLALDARALDWHRVTCRTPDARALATAAVAGRVPAGSTLVVFADERHHALPLDPARWTPDVRGLEEGAATLAAWAAAPPEARPEHVVWMSFPTVLPSGRDSERPRAPALGDRLAGIYTVAAVFAPPLDAVPHRTLAVRPIVSLLERAGP
jgi:MFS family permease